MGHLSTDELYAVRDAAFAAGLWDTQSRRALLQGIMPQYQGALPLASEPIKQLQSDLLTMNDVGRLVDGNVPLELWLRNAVRETLVAEPRAVLQEAHEKVAAGFSGEPEVPPEQLADLPEEIIHEDDTVAYEFLRLGWEAGAAVARIRVPQYSGGAPRRIGGADAPAHLGTAWLVTSSLLMTNHHVVAARDGAEVDLVSGDDLAQQAAHATAQFGFDSDTGESESLPCCELAAWDRALDYAVVRLAAPSDRRPLPIASEPVALAAGERLPVNIIQHPGGDPKRVGLRNNLVDKATAGELRYFTDTRKGSSGSPVLDDNWRVVALHRSARRTGATKFQGRDTSVVNIGTQIHAILADLEQRYPPIFHEIEGQG